MTAKEPVEFGGVEGEWGETRYRIAVDGNRTLWVGRYFGRKGIALYPETPGQMHWPLAYFRNEDAAKEFVRMMYPDQFS